MTVLTFFLSLKVQKLPQYKESESAPHQAEVEAISHYTTS